MKISIVITVYNIAPYIGKCMESILSQTYQNIEVIVVDDCGTDDSMNIVRSYEDDRVKIVSHKENMGAGWSRRHGIEAATGDYVITIDGDDWIEGDFIEKLVLNAKNTMADIVSGGITIVANDGYEEVKRFPEKVSVGFQKFKDYGDGKIVFLNNKLVRRSMYERVPYCTRRYCEDTPVVLPLLFYANKVSYANTQGYYYRQHDNSLCHRVNVFENALFKALCSKDCIKFFSSKSPEYHGLISRAELLGYIKTIKNSITPELAVKYQMELGELMPIILELIAE